MFRMPGASMVATTHTQLPAPRTGQRVHRERMAQGAAARPGFRRGVQAAEQLRRRTRRRGRATGEGSR